MLSLNSRTDPAWLDRAAAELELLLVDHAHCEKKAAAAAMNLLFAYVEHEQLARELSEIVEEELEHFRMVLDVIRQRGMRFRRLRPGPYGRELNELVRREEPDRAVDRLLVAALIEARSCERFSLLGEGLAEIDSELAGFFAGLFRSEARHHSTYVQLACDFAPEDEVKRRLEELAAAEARILAAAEGPLRMHSA